MHEITIMNEVMGMRLGITQHKTQTMQHGWKEMDIVKQKVGSVSQYALAHQ